MKNNAAVVLSRSKKSFSLVRCGNVYNTPSGGVGIKYTPADGAFIQGGFKTEIEAKARGSELGFNMVWPVEHK